MRPRLELPCLAYRHTACRVRAHGVMPTMISAGTCGWKGSAWVARWMGLEEGRRKVMMEGRLKQYVYLRSRPANVCTNMLMSLLTCQNMWGVYTGSSNPSNDGWGG